jgi:hypothetical protein
MRLFSAFTLSIFKNKANESLFPIFVIDALMEDRSNIDD